MTRFQLQPCERPSAALGAGCGRETIQAVRDGQRICSGCEPTAFERAAVEAGRREFLR